MLGHSGRTAKRYPPSRPADVGCCVGRGYRDARGAREGELGDRHFRGDRAFFSISFDPNSLE